MDFREMEFFLTCHLAGGGGTGEEKFKKIKKHD